YDVQAWTAHGWLSVPASARVPASPTGHRANHVRFARSVRTSSVRVALTHRAGAFTGLTELEAWSDAPGVAEAIAPSTNLAFGVQVSASFAAPGFPASDATDMRVAFTRYSHNRWSAA